MNLAILIGVSDYNTPGNNLPACKEDLGVMTEIIKKSQKYDNIFTSGPAILSSKLKQNLSEFIEKYKNQDVDELLFYYSGHGEYSDSEFYYLLSDYNPSKKRQTSLENSELDNWLRTINAKLTVKIVDACYSGVRYVKDPNIFKNYLDSTQAVFNNCYFMFSSHDNQTSEINGKYSDFTFSFFNSVHLSQSGSIRYKDIIDYIADEFQNNKNQIPYFIVQARNTEKFIDISQDLKDYLDNVIKPIPKVPAQNKQEEQVKKNIVELVKKDAEKYCSEDEFLTKMKKLKDIIVGYKYSADSRELYDFKPEFHNVYPEQLKNMHLIGEWLAKNDFNYFANVNKIDVPYTATVQVQKKNAYSNILGISSYANLFPEYEEKEVTRYKKKIDGIELTENLEYICITIDAIPKYESLKWYSCFIVFIFSKIELRFFYSFPVYKLINWKDKTIDSSFNWETSSIMLKDGKSIEEAVNEILEKYILNIMDPIIEKYSENE